MTDSKGVKLTVQEAMSEDIGRNTGILPWRVIDRLNVSGRDVIAYLDQRTSFIHIDGYMRHATGIGEAVKFQVASGRTTREVDALEQFV